MNPVAGSALFSIPNWMSFLKDSGMIGEENGDFTTREAMLSFFNSRTVVIDEVKGRSKFISLSFIDFCEALGRVTDRLSVPTDEDIAVLEATPQGGGDGGVKNMVMYGNKKKQVINEHAKAILFKRRPSSDFMFDSQRPLAEKLERVLNLMIGNIALRVGGSLQSGRKTIKLFPRFVTEEQLTDKEK